MTARYSDRELEAMLSAPESDPHFDAIPVPTATIDDLDLRRFEEEYLPLAVDAATLRQTIAASSSALPP